MQRTMFVKALAVIFAATVATGFAEQQTPRVPPRGTEGPDIRLIAGAQRSTCDGIRVLCPPDSRGVEGPETR
jgi:hypothetical protein